MKKRQIVYTALFICVIVMNFIFPDYLPFMFMWIMILIPVAMYSYGLIMKRCIITSLNVSEKNSVRGLTVHYHLHLENKMMLSVENLTVRVSCQYAHLQEPVEYVHTVTLHSLESKKVNDTYEVLYSGIHQVNIRKVTFMDPLKLFRFSIKCNDSFFVDVMPALVQPERDMLANSFYEMNESFEFSDQKAGDDSSEVFDVRKYIGGDSLNRIHWKLSARKDELLVKEFGMPITRENALVVELHNCDTRQNRKLLDGLYELVYAIMNMSILKEKVIDIFYINEVLERYTVQELSDCEAIELDLIKRETYDGILAWNDFINEYVYEYQRVYYFTDRVDDEILENLNTVHDYNLQVFCINLDHEIGETTTFEGGQLIMVNPQDILQGLREVVL